VQRVKHITAWLLLITSSSHVFCCVLPTVVGVINVFANLGMFSIWLPQFESWHTVMHAYEVQLLMFSGVMLGIAAIVDMISIQIDCHSTGCTHGSCEPAKDRATMILLVATLLFAFNTGSYFFAHKVAAPHVHAQATEEPAKTQDTDHAH